MGLRLRRSITLFPGLRLNLSKSGTSWTIGRPGASINVGKHGTYSNFGIPGTGISSRTKLSGPSSRDSADAQPQPEPECMKRLLPQLRADTSPSTPMANVVAVLIGLIGAGAIGGMPVNPLVILVLTAGWCYGVFRVLRWWRDRA